LAVSVAALLVATSSRAQQATANEVKAHCDASGRFCARYDIGFMSFVGSSTQAGILVLPIGADGSIRLFNGDAVALELGVSAFGPGVNVLGFVRESAQPKTAAQCVRGNELCAPVLGAAMLDLRARFDNEGTGLAVVAGLGYLATALPTHVYDAVGAFFGLEFTPAGVGR
jgi:hypothetical protein